MSCRATLDGQVIVQSSEKMWSTTGGSGELLTNLDSILKTKTLLTDKGQGYSLPIGRVQLWELDHEEGAVPKNWCFSAVVWRRILSPLDCKEIQPVSLKGNQPWIFTGRTDAEVDAPVFWSSDAGSQLTGKVPDAGKDWGKKEKRTSEDGWDGWMASLM